MIAAPGTKPNEPGGYPARGVISYQNGKAGYAAAWSRSSESPLQHSNAELEGQIGALTSRYGEIADEDELQKAKTELAELLTKQFEIQQQIREEEVGQLESRVKKLRGLIDKRKEARQSIIEKRLDQLLREAEGLGWNPGGEGAHRAVYSAPLALPTRVEATPKSASPFPK